MKKSIVIFLVCFGFLRVAKGNSIISERHPFADVKGCVQQSDVTYVAHIFPVFEKFKQKKLCKSKNPRLTSLAADILLLARIHLRPTSRQPLIPEPWINYFHQRFSDFKLVKTYCGKNAEACAGPDSSTLYLMPPFFVGFVYPVQALLHEARHRDGNGFFHVTCTHGFYKGESGGCDESYSEHGAYAFSLSATVNMALRADNLSPVLQFTAGSDAIALAFNSFNRIPGLNLGADLALFTTDNKIEWLEDGSTSPNVLAQAAGPGSLMGRSIVGLTFIPADPKVPGQFYDFDLHAWMPPSSPAKNIGPFLFSYNNSKGFDRTQFIRFYYDNFPSFMLFRDRIIASCAEGPNQTLALSVPAKSVFLNDQSMLNYKDDTALIRLTNDHLIQVHCNKQNKAFLVDTGPIPAPLKAFRKIYQVGPDNYALSRDGRIFVSRGNLWPTGQAQWQPLLTLQGRTYSDFSVIPTLASKDNQRFY